MLTPACFCSGTADWAPDFEALADYLLLGTLPTTPLTK